jgi:hypothetical protein
MNKFVGSNGFLSPEGKEALKGLNKELTKLHRLSEMTEMGEIETRSFGACIIREVKEFVSRVVSEAEGS